MSWKDLKGLAKYLSFLESSCLETSWNVFGCLFGWIFSCLFGFLFGCFFGCLFGFLKCFCSEKVDWGCFQDKTSVAEFKFQYKAFTLQKGGFLQAKIKPVGKRDYKMYKSGEDFLFLTTHQYTTFNICYFVTFRTL